MPPEVKQEMRHPLQQQNKANAKKAVDIEEIRAELQGTMGWQRHIIDEEKEEDMYMHSTDMHPDH